MHGVHGGKQLKYIPITLFRICNTFVTITYKSANIASFVFPGTRYHDYLELLTW